MTTSESLLKGNRVSVNELCKEIYNVNSDEEVFEIFSNISMMDFEEKVYDECGVGIEFCDRDELCWKV